MLPAENYIPASNPYASSHEKRCLLSDLLKYTGSLYTNNMNQGQTAPLGAV